MGPVLFVPRYPYLSRGAFLAVAREVVGRGMRCTLLQPECDDSHWDDWPGKVAPVGALRARSRRPHALTDDWIRLRGLLEDERPLAIIVTSDLGGWRIRALLEHARARRVPVLVVPVVDFRPPRGGFARTAMARLGGLGGPVSRALTAYGWVPGSYARQALLAVRGRRYRDRLRAEGIASDRIVVTGNPAFDRLRTASDTELRRAAQRVVFWTEVAHELLGVDRVLAVATTVATIMRRYPSVSTVLRLHPREPDHLRARYLDLFGERSVLVEEPLTTIATPGVHIGHYSAILYQAALARWPVVSVHPDPDLDMSLFDSMCPPEVHDLADLDSAIASAIADPAQWSATLDAWRLREAVPLDGQAARRVAALLEHLARRGCWPADVDVTAGSI